MFAWLKQRAPDTTRRPVECQVMDLSDDIAYSVHDVEDAIATGAFNPGVLHESGVIDAVVEDARAAGTVRNGTPTQLVDAFARMHRRGTFPGYFDGSRRALAALKNMTSNLIGRFAGSVEQATRDTYGNEPLTRYNGDLVIPEETSYEIVVLKGIAVHFVMAPGEREPMHGEEQRIVGDLVDVFMADNPEPSSALENVFLDDWREAGRRRRPPARGHRPGGEPDRHVRPGPPLPCSADAYTPVSCVASRRDP